MKVFISWSGEYSQAVASMLKQYIPAILQGVEPFMSAHDIQSGTRWASKLADELKETNYGIFCLTPSNLDSAWLIFEAGALSKLEGSNASGLLSGNLKPTDIKNPLSQFQHRRFDSDDVRALFNDINSCLENPVSESDFKLVFDALWPKMEAEYQNIYKNQHAIADLVETNRSEIDLLEEILFRLRSLERNMTPKLSVIEMSPDRLLSARTSLESLQAYTQWKFPGEGVSEHWQNALLTDINIQDYPTIQHIDSVVNKAQAAVEAFAEERSEIFPTGTDYITKSLGFLDEKFRSTHSFGISTRAAFEKYSNLIKP